MQKKCPQKLDMVVAWAVLVVAQQSNRCAYLAYSRQASAWVESKYAIYLAGDCQVLLGALWGCHIFSITGHAQIHLHMQMRYFQHYWAADVHRHLHICIISCTWLLSLSYHGANHKNCTDKHDASLYFSESLVPLLTTEIYLSAPPP